MNNNKTNRKINLLICSALAVSMLAGCGDSTNAAIAIMTGDNISDEVVRVGFEEEDIITELKIGKYYLETNSGIDRDIYIEIFEGNLIQFFGIERKSDDTDFRTYDWNTAPVEYKLSDIMPSIYIYTGCSFDDGIQLGIEYCDENTLSMTMQSDEADDIKDYTPDDQKEQLASHNSIIAHFVYTAD